MTTLLGLGVGAIEPKRQSTHDVNNSVVSVGDGVDRMEEGVGRMNGNGKKTQQVIIYFLKENNDIHARVLISQAMHKVI